MVRRIIHIDLDAFFVSVEQALNPDLKGKPVVVGGDPDSRGVVACASYEARAYGLKAGMSLHTARILCPQAVFLSGGFSRYRDASVKFHSILAEFTPDIEPLGLDEAYLDLTGFEQLYGPVRETALRIKRRIKDELWITASVGIAGSKVVAKVASEMSKPDGLIEVMPGKERIFLTPLPVGKLPCVGPKTGSALKRMGISTTGELAHMPASFLKQTFGMLGEVMHRYANGIDERKVKPPVPPRSISRETTFPQDTSNRCFLRAILHYLGERVGADLRAQSKQARCVTLKLRYADFQTINRARTLERAIDTDYSIFEIGCQLLKKALEHRGQPVRLIGVGVSNLVSGRQLDMFDSSTETLTRLNASIDHIRGKYGFTAIESGCTLPLREIFCTENRRYLLKTPSL
ncbi:DNA polymerase IV [Chloroflexota bacterium]